VACYRENLDREMRLEIPDTARSVCIVRILQVFQIVGRVTLVGLDNGWGADTRTVLMINVKY
jgi:hypothetical protein